MADTSNALPMVLLPPGNAGELCFTVVKLWSTHGMLRRSLWIRSEDVADGEHGVPHASGWLVEGNGATQVEVDRAQAMTKLGRRTLVVLSTPGLDSSSTGHISPAAQPLVKLLDLVSPELIDHSNPGAQSHYFHLIAAPTGMSQVAAADLLVPDFTAHLVASPEDRRAADQMAQVVRPGEGQAAWAVVHAATVAGIWTGLSDDFWTGLRQSGSLESSVLAQQRVMPVRSFVRLVSSAAAARRALESAMIEVADGSINTLAWPAALQAPDPGPIITNCLAGLDEVDGGRIQYTAPQPTPDPNRSTKASKVAIGEFFRFGKREIALVPSAYKNRFKARMSQRLTKRLSGEEGNEVITVAGLGPDETRLREDFERQAVVAERDLAHMEVELPPSAPNLWEAIRDTSLGLLDGSTLPDPITAPISGGQPLVLARPILSVPPPGPWEPSSDVIQAMPDSGAIVELRVPSCSPRDAARVQRLLNEASDELRRDLQLLRATLLEAYEEDLDDTDDEDDESDDGDDAEIDSGNDDDHDSDDEDDAEDDDNEPALVDDEEIDRVENDEEFIPDDIANIATRLPVTLSPADQRRLDTLEQSLETVESASIDLSKWIHARNAGLVWRLADQLDKRKSQAEQDRDAFAERATSVPKVDYGEVGRARNWFVNAFTAINVLTVIAALLLWRFGVNLEELTGGLPVWIFWLALLLLFIFVHYRVLLAYYRRRSRFVFTMRRLLHQQRDARECAMQSAVAVGRLNGVYEQLVEWGELLGFVVHEPWKVTANPADGNEFDALAQSLPACLDVAVPDPDDHKGTALLQQTAEAAIAGRGWRKRAYQDLVTIQLSSEASTESIDLRLLDFDSPAAPNGSRRGLLQALRSGDLQKNMGQHVVQEQAEHLYAGTGNLRNHQVRPVHEVAHGSGAGSLLESEGGSHSTPEWGHYLDAVCKGETQFTRKLWSDIGLMDQDTRTSIDSLAWIRGQLPDDVPLRTGQLQVAPPTENRGVEVVSRIDVGRPSDPDMLCLFSDAPSEIPSAEVQDEQPTRGTFI